MKALMMLYRLSGPVFLKSELVNFQFKFLFSCYSLDLGADEKQENKNLN